MSDYRNMSDKKLIEEAQFANKAMRAAKKMGTQSRQTAQYHGAVTMKAYRKQGRAISTELQRRIQSKAKVR